MEAKFKSAACVMFFQESQACVTELRSIRAKYHEVVSRLLSSGGFRFPPRFGLPTAIFLWPCACVCGLHNNDLKGQRPLGVYAALGNADVYPLFRQG